MKAGINGVLRYVEFYKNPTIGIDYWLFNLISFKKELIYSLFNSNRQIVHPITSSTDIVRLVSLDILTAKNQVIYDIEKLARIITEKFVHCRIYEQKFNRPIKISKNSIEHKNGTNLLPFMIQANSTIPVINKVFGSDGKELPYEKLDLKGKTTYRQ
jgi:hypothetical protein